MRAVSFSFLWGTIVRETATQKALKNCSEEVRWEISICVSLEKGYVHSSTHLGRRLLLVTRHRYLS